VHAVIGKMSFKDTDLVENLEHFIRAIEKVRPATAKGVYIKKITVSGVMTPGVPVRYVNAAETEE
jgi:large subunit ribosomal protein L1